MDAHSLYSIAKSYSPVDLVLCAASSVVTQGYDAIETGKMSQEEGVAAIDSDLKHLRGLLSMTKYDIEKQLEKVKKVMSTLKG